MGYKTEVSSGGGRTWVPVGARPSDSMARSSPGPSLPPQMTASHPPGDRQGSGRGGHVRTGYSRFAASFHPTPSARPALARGGCLGAGRKVLGTEEFNHSCSPRGRQKYSCSLKVGRQLLNAWPLTLAPAFSEKQSKPSQAPIILQNPRHGIFL